MEMKALVIAGLVIAQIGFASQPAAAAELVGAAARDSHREGAFLGGRLRLQLGGGEQRPIRAGLALAPVRQSRDLEGAVRTRFGEGFEFGLGNKGKPTLTLVGQRLDHLTLARSGEGPSGRRQAVSGVGWVAIGVGVAAVVLVLWVACLKDNGCIGSE
jgi:hypothetical protein